MQNIDEPSLKVLEANKRKGIHVGQTRHHKIYTPF